MTVTVSEARWSQLSRYIAGHMGLHFPPERWRDLERGLAAVARDRQFASVEACVDWLLSSPLSKSQVEILASQLTVGETYFFRERQTFQALEEHILPELIRSRRGAGRRLRLWSAGCATGEEPYSVAIALSRALPEWQDWQITILATDINPGFLDKASRGVYKDWSFRDPPAGIQERYFRRSNDGCRAILPAIKDRVTFSYLNLAEDVYPALLNNSIAMDVIFCRNVLMYFAPEQARQVVRNFYRALVEGGWLVVGSAETSQVLYPEFETVNFPGATLYRKASEQGHAKTVFPSLLPEKAPEVFPLADDWLSSSAPSGPFPPGCQESPLLPEEEPQPSSPPPLGYAEALVQYEQGRYAEAAEILAQFLAASPGEAAAMALLARTHANRGQLTEALQWCESAIAADKLNAGWHYLRAMILQEQGSLLEATRSLNRALYLEPGFVLAHFALGHFALRQKQVSQAMKHFDNAHALLRSCPPEDVLPESEGTTAGRLMEIIQSVRTPGETA